MHQLEERDRREDVVAGRDNRGGGESPLEANRQVHKGDEKRQQNGDYGAALELLPYPGADAFSAHYPDAVVTELLFQNCFDLGGNGSRAVGLRCYLRRVLRTDGEIPIRSELLDLGATNSGVVQCRANLGRIGRLGELELHQRTAGELDAVVGRLDGKRSEAEENEADGDRRHHLPPADEVVVGIVKNSKHQMLRVVWASRERLSQIM